MIEAAHISVAYGHVQAVRDVSISCSAGHVTAVLGANGAGKTSLLGAVSGWVPALSGTVTLDGQDVSGWRAERRARAGMAHVPEGRRIIGPLTTEENLLLGAYHVKPRTEVRARVARAYAMFPSLGARRRSLGGLLSGGEQQMLAFGRALMAQPKVMVLDEPCMGLAPLVVNTLMQQVRAIADTGIAVIVVEQNASAALSIADDAVVLDRGELVLEGSTAEVSASPRVLEAFLGIGAEVPADD